MAAVVTTTNVKNVVYCHFLHSIACRDGNEHIFTTIYNRTRRLYKSLNDFARSARLVSLQCKIPNFRFQISEIKFQNSNFRFQRIFSLSRIRVNGGYHSKSRGNSKKTSNNGFQKEIIDFGRFSLINFCYNVFFIVNTNNFKYMNVQNNRV